MQFADLYFMKRFMKYRFTNTKKSYILIFINTCLISGNQRKLASPAQERPKENNLSYARKTVVSSDL